MSQFGQIGCLTASLLCLLAGCQPSAEVAFVGQWEGRPHGAQTPETKAAADTDLAAYDIRITLIFASGGDARMWYGAGERELSGRWKILSSLGPTARLQLAVTRSEAKNSVAEPAIEIRQFQIEWDDDSRTSFTLAEEGADAQFGMLHFRRPTEDNPR